MSTIYLLNYVFVFNETFSESDVNLQINETMLQLHKLFKCQLVLFFLSFPPALEHIINSLTDFWYNSVFASNNRGIPR